MSWNAQTVKTVGITFEQIVAELGREVALRQGVYGQWTANGKMTAEKATAQYGPMLKAHQVMQWLAKVGPDRIKLALEVLKVVEDKPQIFAEAAGSEALKMILEAFPGSKIASVSSANGIAEAA